MTLPRSLACLATLACWLLVLGAAPASAHASLAGTTPADGATVEQVDEVVLEFDEAVSAPPGGLRVFDASAERVDTGTARSLDDRTVAIDLEPGLPDGDHIVTWRVVSADGHPIRGAFVFSVGLGGDVDDELVARLFAGGDGVVVGVLAAVTRAVGYAGTLLAGGALAYLLWVARDDRERRRAGGQARRGAVAGAAAALLTVPLQAMTITGFGPLEALSSDVLGPVVASPTGYAALMRAVLLGVVAVLALRRSTAAGALSGLAVLSFALEGHTRTVEPMAVLVAADVVHLAAAALWFGGLVVLVPALRDRSLDDDPVAAAGLVSRYSGLAALAVVAVTVAGAAMSWVLVRDLRALTSTPYGWVLLAKLALALVVIAIGLVNNRRLVPAVARAAGPDTGGDPVGEAARDGWARLRQVTRVEVGLMVAVLAVTGFLVNVRPAAEAAGVTGVFETTASVTDELSLNLVVDPNRAGDNQIHLYLLDATGRPSDDVEDVLLRLSLPERDIGPIERETFVAGPGHWQLNGPELSIPGGWVIDVVVRVDRSSAETVSVPVVVNPS